MAVLPFTRSSVSQQRAGGGVCFSGMGFATGWDWLGLASWRLRGRERAPAGRVLVRWCVQVREPGRRLRPGTGVPYESTTGPGRPMGVWVLVRVGGCVSVSLRGGVPSAPKKKFCGGPWWRVVTSAAQGPFFRARTYRGRVPSRSS